MGITIPCGLSHVWWTTFCIHSLLICGNNHSVRIIACLVNNPLYSLFITRMKYHFFHTPYYGKRYHLFLYSKSKLAMGKYCFYNSWNDQEFFEICASSNIIPLEYSAYIKYWILIFLCRSSIHDKILVSLFLSKLYLKYES